jgi:hypothetical protein
LISIVLKEGIKVEVSKKMEKWAAQELQYADLGDTRRKRFFRTYTVEDSSSSLSAQQCSKVDKYQSNKNSKP